MGKEFDSKTIWARVRREIAVGEKFLTWSPTGRARSVPFRIESIDNYDIYIRRLNDNGPYKIHRPSIEGIADIWDDYVVGKADRKEMDRFTRASSYALGVLGKISGRYRC